jgi:putative oxidoreductase
MARLLRYLPALALGLVLLVAGLSKALDPAEFAHQIETYGILTGRSAVFLAYLLIPVEIALGSALILRFRPRLAAVSAVVLLAIFMGATGYAWSQGKTEGCGCFGSFAQRTPGEVLLEDSLFVLLGVLAIVLGSRKSGREIRRGMGVMAVVVAAGVVLPLAAYALPLDPVVTDLRVGRKVADLPLGESPIDLSRGDFLVALLDIHDQQSREIVKRLNAMRDSGRGLEVLAFFGGELDEKTIFCFNTSPEFEVVAVPRPDLKRLYRKLPRFFLIRDGSVKRIWDITPPQAGELS